MVAFKILKRKRILKKKNKGDWLFVSEKNLYKAQVYKSKRNKFTGENVVKHTLSVRNLQIILNLEAYCKIGSSSVSLYLPGASWVYISTLRVACFQTNKQG